MNPEDCATFVEGVSCILKKGGTYMLTRALATKGKGFGWNHFTKQQLVELFSPILDLGTFRHSGSVEGDGSKRYFYTVFMRKKK